MSRRVERVFLLLVVVGGVAWLLPRSGPLSANLNLHLPHPVTVHIGNPAAFIPPQERLEQPSRHHVQEKPALSSKQLSILSSITSFSRYLENAFDIISIREETFRGLPAKQKSLADAIGYPTHFKDARNRARDNAKFFDKVAAYGRETYGLSVEQETGKAHWEYVSDFLGHIVRDWTEEGKHERDAIFPPIINALNDGLSDVKGQKRVLIPGFGLGRLAHEIANDRGAFS
jgi:hypothetical protein